MKHQYTVTAERMTYNYMQQAVAQIRAAGIQVTGSRMDPVLDQHACVDIVATEQQVQQVKEILWQYNRGQYVHVDCFV